jgi:endonuclease/exonuclease/phosphatase family metal-dependent hydrolase
MEIVFATINSFFDGVSVSDLNASKWLKLHGRTFMGDYTMVKALKEDRRDPHPVQQLLNEHNPDILVINEVITGDGLNETLGILNRMGFSNWMMDLMKESTSKIKRGTLVVSKRPSEKVKIEIQRFPGGRFSAMQIPDYQLTVIGVQGSPFNKFLRKKQFSTILDYFERFNSDDHRVIVAGDFNMGADLGKIDLPDSVGHYTTQTFPCPNFLSTIRQEGSIVSNLMLGMLKLRKGPRSLDHILYSQNLQLKSGQSMESASDHCALISCFEL